jgi:hypothetical protein
MADQLQASPASAVQPSPSGEFPSPMHGQPPINDPTNQHATLPQRPEGLADKYWDGASGVRMKELVEAANLHDTRAALVPQTADAYQTALPADFKLPEGWYIDDADPTWRAGKDFAHKAGLSQDQFAGLAQIYVEAQIDALQREETSIAAALKARDAALGPNGPARVDALNAWFKGMADNDRVARQLAQTLWTPDIVGFFEKIQLALANQGTVSFRQDGRTQGRTDGKPEGWEQMSALDRRTWNLANERG